MKKFLLLCSAFALLGMTSEASLHAAKHSRWSSKHDKKEHSQKAQRVSCDALCGVSSEGDSQLLDQDAPGMHCAKAWLRMVDGRDYRQAWIAASDYLQSHYKMERWQRFLCSWRPDLGRVESRELTYSNYCSNPRGLPKGQYLVLYYRTKFECYGPTCEQLVLRCERDCACEARWKVARYCVD